MLDTQDGLKIAAYELGGQGNDLVIAHATGFHGRAYIQLANFLTHKYRVFAFDERGHGDSTSPHDNNFSWQGFAVDTMRVVDFIKSQGSAAPSANSSTARPGSTAPVAGQPLIGFGHSAGAAGLLLCEQRHPGTFQALYLYEPVMFPAIEPPGPDPNNFLSVGARRRRDQFESYDDAYKNYTSKPPFSILDPQVLDDYVRYGFDQSGDGSVHLKCKREHEALVYENGSAHDAFQHLGEVACPVVLSCGEKTNAFGPVLIEEFARKTPISRVEVLPGLGHFGPLENPSMVASSVCTCLEEFL